MIQQNQKLCLLITYILLAVLIQANPVHATQLYINELFQANPHPDIPKEGSLIRVKRLSAPKPEPKPLLKIALTFDDGPDAHYTSRILDILKTENVVGTFFVLGEHVGRYPRLVKRIFDEGHLIANHSHTHGDLTLLTNEEIIALELHPASRLVETVTGYYPMIMRPPYGSLRQDSVQFLREEGWKIVRWSLDTFDWDSTRNAPEQIIQRIQAQHHNGAIVLMHCNGPATTRVLPDLIRILRDLGYDFVTVTQL